MNRQRGVSLPWTATIRANRLCRPDLSALRDFVADPEWWRRYQEAGVAGRSDRSRRPLTSPGRKVFASEGSRIIALRRDCKRGIKRLRIELIRLHGLRISADTNHEVVCRQGLNRLKRPRLVRKGRKRYSRPVPGDRVQMDVCGIGPGLTQYTAMDDRARCQVLGLARRKSATSTLAFLDQMVEEIPCRAKGSRGIAARNSSPARCRTGCTTGASSSARSGRGRRTSTAS